VVAREVIFIARGVIFVVREVIIVVREVIIVVRENFFQERKSCGALKEKNCLSLFSLSIGILLSRTGNKIFEIEVF
jgi:hypothetical protein